MKSEAGREIWGRKGWRQREQTSRKISARKRRSCHWPECPTQEWARQWVTGEREWEWGKRKQWMDRKSGREWKKKKGGVYLRGLY